MGAISGLLFIIPAGVLLWRVIVSKSRSWPLRIGAGAAAMITVVGALVVYDHIDSFSFKDWRHVVGLFAAVAASLYLLFWARRHRTNQRYRTVSIIAALFGLVPFVATILVTLLYRE